MINAGSSGISALNYAPSTGSSLTVPAASYVSVVAYGTITSGTIPTQSGDPAAGILAGYEPGVSSSNPVDAVNGNVAGSVLIDDYASITAAAGTDGIRGVNYGTGSVTIETQSGARITGGRYGIGGFAYDGGDVSIINYADVTGSTAAIDASSTSNGTVLIDNYGNVTGEVASYNAAFTNQAGGVWSLNGNSACASNLESWCHRQQRQFRNSGLSSITNSGTIEVQSGSLQLASLYREQAR